MPNLAVMPVRGRLEDERIAAVQELRGLIPAEFWIEANVIRAPGCVGAAMGGFTVNQLQTLVAILRRLQ
jgi:hypothetical protein